MSNKIKICSVCEKTLGDTRSTRCKSHSKMSELNPQWKGNDVGNGSLHEWGRNNFPTVRYCESCYENAPYDLANVTGIYNRDIINWRWLCRKCHMLSDGRLDKFVSRNKRLGSTGHRYIISHKGRFRVNVLLNNGKRKHIGIFNSIEEAITVRNLVIGEDK